eukprot:GFUD01040190.1.p1 GENE.GFUD01040190.1~~GFUD01040190.1.p1  ORF type:complete len:136 (-),score=22.55 GFUD01040190.1:58-435(-)
MSIPRFSNLISAKRFNKTQATWQTTENSNQGSQFSCSTFPATTPHESQMFNQSHSPNPNACADSSKAGDPFSSGNIAEVLKRNEYIMPKSWSEDQMLGRASWQSSRSFFQTTAAWTPSWNSGANR